MSIGISDIVDLLRSRGRGDPPSALADVFVNPLYRTLKYLDAKLSLSRIEQTLDTILMAQSDDVLLNNLATQLNDPPENILVRLKKAIDDIGSNFGIVRKPAAGAQGSVLLMRDTVLNANETITATAGRRMRAPSSNQEYLITETLLVTNMNLDPDLGSYVAAVTIKASTVGNITNAATDQITSLLDSITGVDAVTNKQPVSGGRDEESDADLANRIKTALSANNIGTKSGYRALVLSLDAVKDVAVIGAGDSLMLRDEGDGGSVDIYVADPIPKIVDGEIVLLSQIDPTDPNAFYPTQQPVINDRATATSSGLTTDEIIKDSTNFAGSLKARDKIRFTSALIGGEAVTYQYNSLVSTVAQFLNDDSRKILGSDVLTREVIVTYVDIRMTIVIKTGYTASTVKGEVETGVTSYISSLNIDQDLEQSDVIGIIVGVTGVERLNLPFLKFDRETGTGVLNVIEAGGNEVLRLRTLIVTTV